METQNIHLPPPEDRQVRARLMAAAIRLFSEKGYAGTSVQEIVAAVGVTKPVLYYYFKNKEDLYLEILRDGYADLHALLDGFRDRRGDPVQDFLDLADGVYELMRRRIDVVRLGHSIFYGPPQGAPPFDFESHQAEYLQVFRGIAERGIAAGRLKPADPVDLAFALLAVVELTMEMDLCMPGQGPGREGLQRLLRLVLNGVAAQPVP